MGKYKIIIIIVTMVALLVIGNIFLIPHTLYPELVEEVKYLNSPIDSYNIKCFFIKDEDYNGFYDGFEVLNYFVPKYDFSNFDTDKYTYIISIDREIHSIKYIGLKCKRRTLVFFPDEYQADIECSESAKKGKLRIYKIKKINIDYDYHSDSFIAQ